MTNNINYYDELKLNNNVLLTSLRCLQSSMFLLIQLFLFTSLLLMWIQYFDAQEEASIVRKAYKLTSHKKFVFPNLNSFQICSNLRRKSMSRMLLQRKIFFLFDITLQKLPQNFHLVLPTKSIRDLDKINLVWWFGLRFEPAFANGTAQIKNKNKRRYFSEF